jgi:hypothetical protein
MGNDEQSKTNLLGRPIFTLFFVHLLRFSHKLFIFIYSTRSTSSKSEKWGKG